MLPAQTQPTGVQRLPLEVPTIGASPDTYTALRDGFIVISGGTVSDLSLVRDGTSTSLGITTGVVPMAMFDRIVTTHAGAPLAVFIPRGGA